MVWKIFGQKVSFLALKFRRGNVSNGGLTEYNSQLGIISPIGYHKSPIGDILYNWIFVICFRTLLYLIQIVPIPNWVYYPQLVI